MIVGYHIIFSAYGFWLPNDPRGSWSTFVGAWDLYRSGGIATKTTETCSLAYRPHDRQRRLATKQALRYPPVTLGGVQACAVGRGFAQYLSRAKLPVWACAILPDHVHLVVARPSIPVERLVVQLKGCATKQLEREGVHPLQAMKIDGSRLPKCWSRGQWKVYLDPEDVKRAVDYVEGNPVKQGKRRQEWSFVTPYA